MLKRINRPGTDNLIKYLNASSYATARCYSHHKEPGGLVAHSLEVYELMKKENPNLPEESIAICALLHDLGKARLRGWEFEGQHPARAIQILNRCGYELTEDEAKSGDKAVQDLTDKYIKEIDAITADKTKEVMAV